MKMIINTATTHKGGGVQVARSFLEECKRYSEHKYHVILGEMLSGLVDQSDYPKNFTFYKIGYRPATRVLSFKSHNRDFKILERKIKPDVVFTTTGPAYWRPRAPHLVGFNLGHFIYKDSPFFTQISFYQNLKWSLKGMFLKFFFKRDADAYVVQTDDVNRRLRKWLKKEMVFTVSNTFSQHYEEPKKVKNKLSKKESNEFRFLTLSTWHSHKNLDIIPKVIKVLPQATKNKVLFVLTLPEDIFRNNFSQEFDAFIVNVGPVKPEEGPALYKECDALFLPTLLECFSAAYAEAMKMEKPIITSDLDFAHAICGDAALYADPTDPREIAERIVKLVDDPLLQKDFIQNGLKQRQKFATARERAKQYLEICKNLADAGKN